MTRKEKEALRILNKRSGPENILGNEIPEHYLLVYSSRILDGSIALYVQDGDSTILYSISESGIKESKSILTNSVGRMLKTTRDFYAAEIIECF